jgi:hypothetical protein
MKDVKQSHRREEIERSGDEGKKMFFRNKGRIYSVQKEKGNKWTNKERRYIHMEAGKESHR